jgi:hypothetical protein
MQVRECQIFILRRLLLIKVRDLLAGESRYSLGRVMDLIRVRLGVLTYLPRFYAA